MVTNMLYLHYLCYFAYLSVSVRIALPYILNCLQTLQLKANAIVMHQYISRIEYTLCACVCMQHGVTFQSDRSLRETLLNVCSVCCVFVGAYVYTCMSRLRRARLHYIPSVLLILR